MVGSFIIYFWGALLSSLAFDQTRKTKRRDKRVAFFFVAIGIPVLIAGVRYATGTDFFSYINGFERIKLGYDVRWADLEFGFVWLNHLLVIVGLNAQSIMFTSSLVMMIFISKALYRKRETGIIGYGFLAFMFIFYQSSFNVIRLMIAASIFLYNIHNIEKRQFLRYFILTIFASSFHIPAIITLPLYWLFNAIKIERSWILRGVVYFIIGGAIVSFSSILEYVISITNVDAINYYSKYASGEGRSISVALKILVMYIPLAIPGLIYYRKLKLQDKSFPMYYSLVVIGIIVKVLAIMQTTYVDRVAEYLLIASVMLIPTYMKLFSRDKNYLFYLGMITYLFMFWIYNYFIVLNHGTVPYQWIF